MENLISGLISGLVTTLLVVVFRSIWISVITPWFEERVYKDVRIEGKWFTVYPNWGATTREEVVNLDRKGHAVNGDIVCISESDKGEKYMVSGSFRNMILTCTYESNEKTKSDRGSLSLRAVKNGKRLVGKIAFYSDNHETIETETVLWFRTKEDAEEYIAEITKKQEKLKKLKKAADSIEIELNIEEEITKPVKSDNKADASQEILPNV